MCGSWARSQARQTWAGVAPCAAAADQHDRVLGHFRRPREGRAEREVRHPGDVVLAAEVEERFVGPVQEVVGILYARDAGRESLAELVDVRRC